MLLVLGCHGLLSPQAHAQLFGSRNVGSPLNSPFNRGGAGNAAATAGDIATGVLDGNERFVRGNRSRNDFVGSNRSSQTGFVGAGQAIGVGRVRTATEGLRVDASNTTRINRPLPAQPQRGMYYPRLELSFNRPGDSTLRTEIAPDMRIQQRATTVAGEDARVPLAGRTAILRGQVDSQHTAELTGRILSFEPGIDQVQNELTVR
ncbi:MAG: hypothetical protein KDA37_16515 [Planctomycetales bacterium]|nr:hypothetical protein [Planctomycetales bacterium]